MFDNNNHNEIIKVKLTFCNLSLTRFNGITLTFIVRSFSQEHFHFALQAVISAILIIVYIGICLKKICTDPFLSV